MDNWPNARKWLPKLGWPVYMLALWLALGWGGFAAVGRSWRAAQVAEFERSVRAVAQLVVAQQWQDPWESDPQWQLLEDQLGIDLVPLGESAASPTQWHLGPGGNWRASVTMPVSGHASIQAVRGTRTYTDHGIDRIWWGVWSGLALLYGAAAWALLLLRQRRLDNQREEIALWNNSPFDQQLLRDAEHEIRQFQSLLGNLHEGVMAVDQTGRIVFVNGVLKEQFGLPLHEDYRHRRLLEVLRVPNVLEMVEHVLRSRQLAGQVIETGNPPRYLKILVAPQPLDNAPPGALLTATDVSSSQRSELARREFITGASHELKTPLAAIRAYTETLQSMAGEDPEMAARFLQNILDQADRMNRLVNGMLQLARAESGTLKLKVQRLDAAMTLKPCIEAAVGMALAKDIQFTVDIPDQRIEVLADRDALQTIASNLLSNALRYTPAGGQVSIELSPPKRTEPFSPSQPLDAAGFVLLAVSDTGIGIAPADQSRIFERFYRVQKDRALDSGGTGLGLAIVKQLVQVLEGTVHVISQPGKGTRFEIGLPAVGFTQSSSKLSG